MTRRLVPLTVWLCSDAVTSAPSHSKKRTTAADLCPHHRGAVGRELARHLIGSCTSEGDVVAEAFAVNEATLVTAARMGRRGVALVPHFPLAKHIGTRLRATLPENKLRSVAMRPCRPDQMRHGLADLRGDVGLVIAAPPPYEAGGRASRQAGSQTCPACRSDLWMLSTQQLAAFLAATWQVLRPGGHLAIITTVRYEDGRLIDPAPRVIQHANALGFRYVQHVIALRVPVEGDCLMVQATPTELAQLRDVRSRALPPVVTVHADVCLFTRPDNRARRGRV
ncbi:hypothetical protein Acsp04_65090 [Actinomadura sp. NBRC 104425]|uniref:hypothetical protein n=1 Tax=Actinomadura sp. NBRC 104425 TaxID=3032204 RepID=UPI0024A1CE27|nr:hypothetical protein [Actinomadura sp. NBRC 104425]GLZ16274.1 hypothetical protein Acsp04_65090 [Actinomadura sp. NBRC 104425]